MKNPHTEELLNLAKGACLVMQMKMPGFNPKLAEVISAFEAFEVQTQGEVTMPEWASLTTAQKAQMRYRVEKLKNTYEVIRSVVAKPPPWSSV